MQDVPDFYLTSYIVLLGVDGNGRQRRILVAASATQSSHSRRMNLRVGFHVKFNQFT